MTPPYRFGLRRMLVRMDLALPTMERLAQLIRVNIKPFRQPKYVKECPCMRAR